MAGNENTSTVKGDSEREPVWVAYERRGSDEWAQKCAEGGVSTVMVVFVRGGGGRVVAVWHADDEMLRFAGG